MDIVNKDYPALYYKERKVSKYKDAFVAKKF